MTEVLFGLSAAFFGYVIYVLVDEQMTINSAHQVYLIPETEPQPAKEAPPKPSGRNPARKGRTKVQSPKVNKVPEQVGSVAGSVYRYLEKNGAISVAKMVRELKEDSKTIQRSIGWLAQEGKINLAMVKRIEMISLSDSQ